jgi:hypothetical protein
MVPVVWSSEGSRVSIRILFGSGVSRSAFTWSMLGGKIGGSRKVVGTYIVEEIDFARLGFLRVESELGSLDCWRG